MLGHLGSLRDLLLFGPVIVLWSLGFWVALRSGLERQSGSKWVRMLTENASRLLVRLVICMLVLVAAMQLVGYRLI